MFNFAVAAALFTTSMAVCAVYCVFWTAQNVHRAHYCYYFCIWLSHILIRGDGCTLVNFI